MRRFLILVLVFVAVFAVSCSKKKSHEENDYVEQVSKEIKAEEGGTVESSDGKTSVAIPAGALESDTVISITIYNAEGYAGLEDLNPISMVVEFEPSGIIFKKPVLITMPALENVEKRTITAAVYRENEGKWSFSETGAAVKVSLSEAGDPIMTSAAGDPIMLNASGDPIMTSASGDPIMLSASGDPIMATASGDPIMNVASGDPIMMTTGHFTSFTFLAVEPKEPAEHDDTEPVDDGDTTPAETDDDEPVKADDDEIEDIDDNEVVDEDDDIDEDVDDNEVIDEDDDDVEVVDEDENTDIDTPEPDEDTEPADNDIVPEPEPVYSKVLCTNISVCMDGAGKQIVCPDEGEEFYGQDVQYAARKGCIAHHSYTEIPNSEDAEAPFVKDNATGLTWYFTGLKGSFAELKDSCNGSYGGIDNWRLPTPKELLTLTDLGRIYMAPIDPVYFKNIKDLGYNYQYDEGDKLIVVLTSVEGYVYLAAEGSVSSVNYISPSSAYLMCVSGNEYGTVAAEDYVTVTENEEEMIHDVKTDLFWQKDAVKKETWKEALGYCENLEYAGHSDWRLPNRNELISLIDYSKAGSEEEVEFFSSFPGMTPGSFWSSTPSSDGEYVFWLVYMEDGNVSTESDYWNTSYSCENPEDCIRKKNIKRDEIEEIEESEDYIPSVRCVRSDLIENTGIPVCSETGIAPCRNTDGTIWSSPLYVTIFEDFDQSNIFKDYPGYESIYWNFVAEMCRDLTENGSHKWRLPTIDELRALITGDNIKKGGSCRVTTECVDYESCWSEEECGEEKVSMSSLYDYGVMLSGTLTREYTDTENYDYPEVWAAYLEEGGVFSGLYPVSDYAYTAELVQRCVLDESLDYKEAPYTDTATGLLWSDISPKYMKRTSADGYCLSLSEDDMEHYWRLPDMEELFTIRVNCAENEEICSENLNGKHSVFGDVGYLWSSDIEEGESYNTFLGINFSNGEVLRGRSDYDYYTARVRCVSDGPNPCAESNCSEVAHSTGRCIPESTEDFACECEEDYFYWNGACSEEA